MLVRDRVSRLRFSTNRPYICPSCLSRAHGTQSSLLPRPYPSVRAGHGRLDLSNLRRRYAPSRRSFSTSWASRAPGAASARSISPNESPLQFPSSLTFENPEDVRSYLKKWSDGHQKEVKDNAPDRVQLQRDAVLPNSLFIKNNNEPGKEAGSYTNADPNTVDPETEYGAGSDNAEDAVITSRPQLHIGDALRVRGKGVRPQLAIYLGKRGVQSLYFLADGRWLADTQIVFNSHIIHGVATHDEISRIEKYLPLRTVEYIKVEDGATVPFSALGEIPHNDSRPLLDKLANLSEEVEGARREYLAFNDRVYNFFADEYEFKHAKLETLVRDILNIDYDTLNEGAKLFLQQEVSEDERLMTWQSKNNRVLLYFLPKSMHRSTVQVTQWARSYQDAAARAAVGKSVSEELQKNPLIPFITKARRLISKSRKIRLPTTECELGPTLENVRPSHGLVERKPTGEEFSEDEKKIIEFLWLVYVKRPLGQTVGTKRSTAIASMIVRAVGAYPKFRLDISTGMLFLKELGCLDPWAVSGDYFVNVPSPLIPLNQGSRLMKEKARKAAAEYGMQREDETSRLPDSMAHLRHDWGDLEVFCVDSASTVVRDDGISVERSQEHPDHYWIRVHIAHISAYVPHDNPLLALGELMGAAQYHQFGSESYIPMEALMAYSLRPGASVLTFSTLLGPDGSIKDIDVRPGVVRNVINIHGDVFESIFSPPSTPNTLCVGTYNVAQPQAGSTDREREQLQLIQRHRADLDLIQKLVLSRWEARFDANPHLQMLKLPKCNAKVTLHPSTVYQEGRGYDRIFRSEHLIGDLSIIAKCSVADFQRESYRDQSIRNSVIAGAMLLACESAALWTSARSIPTIYRTNESEGESGLLSLNKLGPHDYYISPASGESVDMKPNVSLATKGYTNINNPLRRYRDVVNHHQIDAYLKAQAGHSGVRSETITYPRSRQELLRAIAEESNGSEISKLGTLQTNQWLMVALYRAFYFGEAKLPEVWDMYMDNPVNIGGSNVDEARTSKGTIYAIGVKAQLLSSEQGWEKMAKFRQWLPVKLTTINPTKGVIFCQAVGPPSDEPSVRDLVYPPMKAS